MKPTIPKGTRDFSPAEMVRRNFIFNTIREVFERYGYQPIETPAMENLETLMGKYGEEGDRLIFKILARGEKYRTGLDLMLKSFEKGEISTEPIELTPKGITSSGNIDQQITDSALRYDLTVPFARYVVQHQNEISFPFKRYQIQPVWRADRPQKGRYREFYQCDADVIGSNSLLNEVELVQMINDVYSRLGISVTIKINNRKILSGLAALIGEPEKIIDITIAIDKFDKIGNEGVLRELEEKGVKQEGAIKLMEFIGELSKVPDGEARIEVLKKYFNAHSVALKGVDEVDYIFENVKNIGSVNTRVELDVSLARGLNYYTGAIFEVKANDVQIGSICGGGRYDDLTGIFGLPNVSGVGISFGIDRIYDVMNELCLFEKLQLSETTTQVMLAHFGEAERNYCVNVAAKLRTENINTEIYPDLVKIKKQFDYANKKKIPFVIVVGEEEMNSGILTLKNMGSGEQLKLKVEEVVQKLRV